MESADEKAFRICNVLGGLDVTRFVSSNTRNLFQGAIEDVELIREYVHEAFLNGGIGGGFSDLQAMNASLEWKERNFSRETTTYEAGLGYVDDRANRRIDRNVAEFSSEMPLVGDRQTDMQIVDTLSNLFPWLVDRRSVESSWYITHKNGRSEGKEKAPFRFSTLYTAAWFGTHGNAWMYYPPFTAFSNGHPLTMNDVIGGDFMSHELPFVKPNLPKNNPSRKAFLVKPYPDTAQPGLSLITAMAPVYLNGKFGDYTYNDTYFASTGVDIAVVSTSTLLDELLDKMTELSFAILVDTSFGPIVISQAVVDRIYPERTGFEVSRVTYDLVDGSTLEDRRNQTYLVSDTIHQALTNLENANWSQLLREVKRTRRGGRGSSIFNLTLTGETQAREFQVMYERWPDVADWIMLTFAPTDNIDKAVDFAISSVKANATNSVQTQDYLELSGEWGSDILGEVLLMNNGALDILVTQKSSIDWLNLYPDKLDEYSLAAKSTLSLQLSVDTSKLEIGTSSFSLTFGIEDDNYPDCFHSNDVSFSVNVKVEPKKCALLTGNAFRIADELGNCICSSNSVEIGGSCIGIAVLLPSFLVPLCLICFLSTFRYIDHKRKQADSIWLIKTSDLSFDDPPIILGRGTFGLVVCAEYRGTQVAVKRVIPAISQSAMRSSESYGNRLGSILKFTNGKAVKMTSHDKFDFSNLANGDAGMASTQSSVIHNGPSAPLSSSEIPLAKTTRKSRLAQKEFAKLKADFIREMRLLSKLRHPCITTVMGAVISSVEEPLLVMELMDHGSLFDLLHNDTMIIEGDMVLQVLRDISQGLRFLHSANPQVIHGDLKALNVLVDRKFRAKVADFGLSQKKNMGATGTPYWMAPELLMGKSSNTAASDVYSFGIILYEVYSRKVPYEGEEFEETIREICDPSINKRPISPVSMPMEIVRLFHDCTNVNPEIRPTFRAIDDILKSFNVSNVEPKFINTSIQNKKAWDTSRTATENLLLEVFPKHVAEALIRGDRVEPESFDCVTIFFSDIVGFTNIASELTPIKVSDMLDRLYQKFDKLSRKHGVFKVETIGDAWMGVTNLETPQPDHATRIADFAMDALRAASITMIDQEDASRGMVNIRVGFHSGPVIANVVGSRNPKFTLIGDTVNSSSRMESNSLPGRVHCSPQAAKLLEEQANDKFLIESRGLIEIKGKGQMETFWVTEKKPMEKSKSFSHMSERARNGKYRRSDCDAMVNFLSNDKQYDDDKA
jgi:serine/threonine protein kinase